MKLKGFTLVEMLIVIVIIGVLSAALVPRIVGVRARARDVSREADAHDLVNAIIAYSIDNQGLYPEDGYSYLSDGQILNGEADYDNIDGDLIGSVKYISSDLSYYMSEIPSDPSGDGVRADAGGQCVSTMSGDYAYFNSFSDSFAVTVQMEKNSGNSSDCRELLDTDRLAYKTFGQGLIHYAQPAPDHCFDVVLKQGSSTEGKIVKYTVSDDCPTNLVIPPYIDGIKITALNSYHPEGGGYNPISTELTSLTLPYTITTTNYRSFINNTNLVRLELPGSFESIGTNSFRRSGLKDIILHEGIKTIGDDAFQDCKATYIYFPSSITSIEKTSFSGCSDLETVSVGPNTIYRDQSMSRPSFPAATNIIVREY